MTALLALLSLLAVWRLARLVAVDYLTERLRFAAERRSPWLGYLASCPWCISIWLAPLIVAPAMIWPTNRLVWIVIGSLAASAAAGLLSTVEDALDSRR